MPSRALQTPIAVMLLLGAALFIVLGGLHLMASVVAPILLAYTLAVVLLPMVGRLEATGMPRPLALVCVFLAAFVIAVLIILFVGYQLQHLAGRVPTYQRLLELHFAHLGAKLGGWGLSLNDLWSGSQAFPRTLARKTLGLISQLLGMLGSLVLFLFVLLTMILDFPGVSRAYHRQLTAPPGPGHVLAEIQTHYRLQTLSNFASAVAIGGAYLVFRVDFAILWALLTFFLSYIPRFGMLLSFVPAVVMAFVQYGLRRALVLLVVVIMLNGAMDNFITPMLSKKGLGLRASTVLVSSLLWLWVFGPIGALLAVPLTLIVRKLLLESAQTTPLANAMSTDDYAPASGSTEAP